MHSYIRDGVEQNEMTVARTGKLMQAASPPEDLAVLQVLQAEDDGSRIEPRLVLLQR